MTLSPIFNSDRSSGLPLTVAAASFSVEADDAGVGLVAGVWLALGLGFTTFFFGDGVGFGLVAPKTRELPTVVTIALAAEIMALLEYFSMLDSVPAKSYIH